MSTPLSMNDKDMADRIRRAITELRAGRMVILVDDEDRENEGDLVCAGELCTPDQIRFMMEHARGEFCLAVSPEKADALDLALQVNTNSSPRGTAFTVTIDARAGGTGVSAADRALTCVTASKPDCRPQDLIRPGHIHPLRARAGGVLVRTGHTEGSVDLMRLAGLQPAAVIIEVVKADGDMARMEDLEKLSRDHNLLVLTIADIVAFRLANESLVRQVEEHTVKTRWGTWRACAFEGVVDQREALALVKGNPATATDPVVRVHSGGGISDVFAGLGSDSGLRLDRAMDALNQHEHAVMLYLPHEGDVMRLGDLLANQRQSEQRGELFLGARGPAAGASMGMRHYGIGAQVLRSLGLTRIRLMSNNAVRLKAITGFGLEIVDVLPIPSA